MIEQEVLRLYKRLKSRTLAAIKRDAVYEEFVRLLTTGKRKYALHNSELVKSVDEAWVKAIEECIPHLDAIVNNPRRYIKQTETVVPVELAKKTTAASVRHLASNAQNIDKIERGQVIPKKILSTYQEESYELYENRFVMTLLDRASQFVERRYRLLGEKGGDEFTSELSAEGGFRQNDEDTEYSFSIKIHQGAEYLGGRGVAAGIFDRLETVRGYFISFKRSKFMREMSGCNPVRPPVMKTNLLSKDPDYRACYRLWQFMDRYDKVGYSVEVTDVNPTPDEEFLSELDALLLFEYLVLKNKMAEYGEGKAPADYRRKRTVRPKFSKEYNKDVPEAYQAPDRSVLKVNLDGSNAREVNQRLRKAVGRALTLEAHKKNLEQRERNMENQRILQAVLNALALEKRRDKNEARRSASAERNIEKLLADLLAREGAPSPQKEEGGTEAAAYAEERPIAQAAPEPEQDAEVAPAPEPEPYGAEPGFEEPLFMEEVPEDDGPTDIAGELSAFEELILHRGDFVEDDDPEEDEAEEGFSVEAPAAFFEEDVALEDAPPAEAAATSGEPRKGLWSRIRGLFARRK